MGTRNHCTVNDQRSHTGYSNTGSYSGQGMTRHTNTEKQAQQGKAKKMNTTQTKTGKYPKSIKTTGEGEAQGGGVQPSGGSVAWAAGKSTC